MKLKTKSMQKILVPIEEKVKKLRSLLENNNSQPVDIAVVKSMLHEQLRKLAEKFASICKEDGNDYQEMKDKITAVIEEFCTSIDIDKLEKSDHEGNKEDVTEILLSKFVSALENLEKLECLPMKQNLQDCWDYVKDMGAVNEIEDFQNIKELGTSILDIFGPLQQFKNNLSSQQLKEKLALYLCQLCATFDMLVKLIEEQHQLNAPIFSCKKYVCDRLCWCFKAIIEILDASNPSPEEEFFEKENHFVYRMDLVLDIISGMVGRSQKEQMGECEDLWHGIEDVFSHAMAIAQVCQPQSFKSISGVCQSIMSEYENLKVQLQNETPEPSMINLFMNSLTDALYRLERKVNISVLSLVMEVFSDPFNPLRKLVKTCGISLTARKRSKTDLSDTVEDFDQLIDQAMQIGSFAIACCRDTNRVNKIKNCLASLESLEMELVPAITDFYLHPDNKEKRASVKLLTAQWQAEINKFHNFVDLIIDSAAYCQVILDDIQERVTTMSNCLDNREGVYPQHVQGVVQRALALASQISATVDDIGRDTIDRQTIMKIRELKAAIYEADAASKTLLTENTPEPQQLRVIKRCEMILNVVKNLQPVLVSIMNNSILMNTSYKNPGMGQGDSLYSNSSLCFPANALDLPQDQKSLAYIRTPYTVSSFKQPLSIQPANSVPRTSSDLTCLIPYIKRGRNMRLDQSIMYKTPKEATENGEIVTNELKLRNLSSVRQHLFSRDSFLNNGSIDLTAESLDLTSILEKITGLSDTFTSLAENSSEKISVAFNQLAALKDSFATQKGECSSIGGGDAPSAVETPERIEDLQKLDKKIQVLQKQKELSSQ
ncbi:uncharacterized protein LOC117172011 [Belonocnema kinseyi]|uniref:uncharacterized protein LOC117172011 n=1 Tax=Belonocnema kinseyi TaxID=2817044 RepID=UPI00143D5AAC|nr:uncharacterized protein LOC117172011 [Belonocnema kinseyi]